MRALIADDREDIRLALELLLKRSGHQGEGVGSPREVEQALARSSYDVVLLDLNYTRDTTSGEEGLALLRHLRRSRPALPLVAMTAWGSVELAVEAMREGASDFVLKPWDDEKLLQTLERHGAPRPEKLDLDRAGRVQARFRARAVPAGGPLECAGACDEAAAVGGDVFDVLDLGRGRLGLLVGDAAGRGVSGALLIA
ncbi:MAG TPA: response regulator, partial [Vicinamibacteria bacterium]|nr:response regulator [Vicinamibacteria bacterium]